MSKSTRNPTKRAAFYRSKTHARVDDSRTTCGAAKFAFRLRRDAEKARDAMRQRTGLETLDVYRCADCNKFHVGKSRYRGPRVREDDR